MSFAAKVDAATMSPRFRVPPLEPVPLDEPPEPPEPPELQPTSASAAATAAAVTAAVRLYLNIVVLPLLCSPSSGRLTPTVEAISSGGKVLGRLISSG